MTPTPEVRQTVRDILTQAQSFQALPLSERKEIASALVRVMSYLADPAAGQSDLGKLATVLDEESRDQFGKLRDRLAKTDQKLVGEDFKAGAMRESTKAFKDLVDTVDFPKFVSGLIDGVFTSIVDSSIKQMKEFGKFLDGVTKSLKDFADDNVDEKGGRDWLQQKFPKAMKIDPGSGKLAMNDDLDEKDMPDLKGLLGLSEPPDLSDEEVEKKVVESARLKIAKMRQQQLATMVMLGINRIVVTDGEIKASVTFDVKSSDKAHRANQEGMNETESGVKARSRSSGGWFSDDEAESSVQTRVATTNNATQEDSDSKAESKAQLTGFVRVKFKSETFPLEKMANPSEMFQINEKATP